MGGSYTKKEATYQSEEKGSQTKNKKEKMISILKFIGTLLLRIITLNIIKLEQTKIQKVARKKKGKKTNGCEK